MQREECACAIGMPRDSERERGAREGDDFQFYSTNVNGRVPSSNFESNWLSDHRLRKQMSVDFVARAVEASPVEIRGATGRILILAKARESAYVNVKIDVSNIPLPFAKVRRKPFQLYG